MKLFRKHIRYRERGSKRIADKNKLTLKELVSKIVEGSGRDLIRSI
jgi:hypothetical protein